MKVAILPEDRERLDYYYNAIEDAINKVQSYWRALLDAPYVDELSDDKYLKIFRKLYVNLNNMKFTIEYIQQGNYAKSKEKLKDMINGEEDMFSLELLFKIIDALLREAQNYTGDDMDLFIKAHYLAIL
jgi:hypothetical protein